MPHNRVIFMSIHRLLIRHWRSLFKKTEPYYRAVKLAGAGGGGYALFLSDSSAQAQSLREALGKISGTGSGVVPFKLNRTGLQVSVL